MDNKIELKFLGIGSAFNTDVPNTSAYTYFKDKNDNKILLLIDCGSGIFNEIIKRDILYNVSHVYITITHMHPDHICDLGNLIFYLYYVADINVTLLSLNNTRIYSFLSSQGISEDLYNRKNTLYSNENINIPDTDVNLRFIYNNHHTEFVDSIYIIIENKRGKIFYTGDVGPQWHFGANLRDIDWNTFDMIYHEVSSIKKSDIHCSVEDLKYFANRYDIDRSKITTMHYDYPSVPIQCRQCGFTLPDYPDIESYMGSIQIK